MDAPAARVAAQLYRRYAGIDRIEDVANDC